MPQTEKRVDKLFPSRLHPITTIEMKHPLQGAPLPFLIRRLGKQNLAGRLV